MSARNWDRAFLAVGALLGEPLEPWVAALGGAPTPEAKELMGALRSSSRDRRALAIARVLSEAARDVDALVVR
jgi:hypothetical protein